MCRRGSIPTSCRARPIGTSAPGGRSQRGPTRRSSSARSSASKRSRIWARRSKPVQLTTKSKGETTTPFPASYSRFSSSPAPGLTWRTRPVRNSQRRSPAIEASAPVSKTPRSQCLTKSRRVASSRCSQPTSSGSAKTRFSRKLSPRLSGRVGREHGQPRPRPKGTEEDEGAEGALAAADDRDLGIRFGRHLGEGLTLAVAVEDPVGDRRVVGELAMHPGAGQQQGAAAVALGVLGPGAIGDGELPDPLALDQRDLGRPPVEVRDTLPRPNQHPTEVSAVVAVADRRRFAVDPGRVAAAFDRVALPGEGQQAGVDRVAGVAELARAAVGEADVLDRRDRQRLLAGGHPVAAEPGGGGHGFLDHRDGQRPEPEPVDHVDLGGDRRRLGAGADDQQVADALALAHAATRGSATTRPLWSGLKEIALLRTRSARPASAARSSTLASTVLSTRFISISA